MDRSIQAKLTNPHIYSESVFARLSQQSTRLVDVTIIQLVTVPSGLHDVSGRHLISVKAETTTPVLTFFLEAHSITVTQWCSYQRGILRSCKTPPHAYTRELSNQYCTIESSLSAVMPAEMQHIL